LRRGPLERPITKNERYISQILSGIWGWGAICHWLVRRITNKLHTQSGWESAKRAANALQGTNVTTMLKKTLEIFFL
jgi:hypothetical protein